MSKPNFAPEPIVLESDAVRLQPLAMEHVEAFNRAGRAPELWRWVKPNQCESLEQTRLWISESLEQQAQGQHLPFVIVDKPSGQIIGSTRYCSIRPADRNVEIGFTFITPEFQRTHVNTHCKYLLMRHAFETLGAIRVEYRTHENNNKSRNAILRIGAQFEGILRNSRILPDGTYRNTALFSITEQEWPDVKAALELKMQRKMIQSTCHYENKEAI